MNENDKAKPALPFSPLGVLNSAIKAVPAVRYALGVAGVGAAVALIAGLNTDPRVAVFGIIIMFGLMAGLVVFSNLVRIASRRLKLLAELFAWSSVLLIIATSFLIFTGFFFDWPRPLPSWFPPAPSPTTSPPRYPPKTKVTFTSPRHSQNEIVYTDEQGNGWLEVKGTVENMSADKDLRIYVFSQLAQPEVTSWRYHGYADPNEHGEWAIPRVVLGRVGDEVLKKRRFRIQAIIGSKNLRRTIENPSNNNISNPALFHPLDSATVNIIISQLSKGS